MRVPDVFRAYVVHRRDDRLERGLRDLRLADLPPGDVLIQVAWSTVNYKDGLAVQADGKVARAYPLVPGIDLAGTVVASGDPAFATGTSVIASGYDIGVSHHGGYSELARMPAGWIVPLPAELSAREAMAIGTAGFTAAMSVVALEDRGLRPGDGPVLVTGASGGVGGTAVGILASRGHEVWAATGKADEVDRLKVLGAAGTLTRGDVAAPASKPLESARWAGAVDTVGGPTLPYILRTLRRGAAVAVCGNAGGVPLETTVQPLILRGVAMLGMDSAGMPIVERRRLWQRLANDLRPPRLGEAVAEVDLDGLEPALDAIVAGQARGRWVVRLGG